MDKHDKKLLKDSAMVILDNAVASVDLYWQQKTGLPFQAFSTCWGLLKTLYGNVIVRRKEKALELVKMVSENKTIFNSKVLSDKKFQDGFVYMTEKYLIERNKIKRLVARNILLGFAKAEDKDNFPLERMSHVLTQLSEEDIGVLRDVKPDEQGQNYQIYGNGADKIENIYNLISQGILFNTTGNRLGYDSINLPPFVKISTFGKNFMKYIYKDEQIK